MTWTFVCRRNCSCDRVAHPCTTRSANKCPSHFVHVPKNEIGVTLVEMVLVIVIGTAILLLSIRQYQSYLLDANVEAVQANVDNLFAALANYYQANCGPSGTLGPKAAAYVSVDIQNELVANGYLTAFQTNPVVAAGPAWSSGYVVQFNQIALPPQTTIPSYRTTTLSPPTTSPTTAKIGVIIAWEAQVAVQLADQSTAISYLNMLGGNCLSSKSGSIVSPCTSGQSGAGNYVVWSRSPSFAAPLSASNYWITMPTVKLFNQIYSTYPILYLISQSGNIPTDPAQYFLCGS